MIPITNEQGTKFNYLNSELIVYNSIKRYWFFSPINSGLILQHKRGEIIACWKLKSLK